MAGHGCFPQPSSSRDASRGRGRSPPAMPVAPVLGTQPGHDPRAARPVAHPGWSAGQADRPRPQLTQGRIDVAAESSLPTVHLPPAERISRPSHTACLEIQAWPTAPGSLEADRQGGPNVLLVPGSVEDGRQFGCPSSSWGISLALKMAATIAQGPRFRSGDSRIVSDEATFNLQCNGVYTSFHELATQGPIAGLIQLGQNAVQLATGCWGCATQPFQPEMVCSKGQAQPRSLEGRAGSPHPRTSPLEPCQAAARRRWKMTASAGRVETRVQVCA